MRNLVRIGKHPKFNYRQQRYFVFETQYGAKMSVSKVK